MAPPQTADRLNIQLGFTRIMKRNILKILIVSLLLIFSVSRVFAVIGATPGCEGDNVFSTLTGVSCKDTGEGSDGTDETVSVPPVPTPNSKLFVQTDNA